MVDKNISKKYKFSIFLLMSFLAIAIVYNIINSNQPVHAAQEAAIYTYSDVEETIISGVTNASTLTYADIPEGVIEIGNNAFKNVTTLKKLTLSSTVQIIGSSAFEGCTNLAEVNLNEGLLQIKEYAFNNLRMITELTLPSTLTTIENNAFSQVTELKELHFPKNLTNVGQTAFLRLLGATKVTVDEDNAVFANTEDERIIYFKATNTAFIYAGKSGTTYTIPDNIEIVGNNLFDYCTSLKEIVFSKNITLVGSGIFNYLQLGSTLKEIVFESVTPPTFASTYFLPASVSGEVMPGLTVLVPDESYNEYFAEYGVNENYKNVIKRASERMRTITLRDYNGSTISSMNVPYGTESSSIDLPTPFREGYTFIGFGSLPETITDNITLTAQYIANSYTVVFKDHDGTILKSVICNHGELFPSAPSTPSNKKGWFFSKWDISPFPTTVTSNIEITAVYEKAPASTDVTAVIITGAVSAAVAGFLGFFITYVVMKRKRLANKVP